MTVKVVIFDFDGTIADTLDTLITISNSLADEFGYKKATPTEVNHLRNLTPKQIIRNSGISVFKLPFILKRIRIELNNSIKSIKAIPGIEDVLIELKNQNNILGIITSNSKENVTFFLEKNNLQEVFDFIYSGSTLFGKSRIINNFLNQQQLKPEEVIYVGDESRDIEASKASNVKAIAVTWGFNTEEVLLAQQPDFLIHQPMELINVIKSLQNNSI